MSEHLYILPLSLKPCEPVDSSYTHHFNQSHTSIANPLKKALNIELYKETRFSKPPELSSPPFLHYHTTLSVPSERTFLLPTLVKLHEDTHIYPSTPPF